MNNDNKALEQKLSAGNIVTEEILFDGLLKDNVGLSLNFLVLSWNVCCNGFWDDQRFMINDIEALVIEIAHCIKRFELRKYQWN